MERGLRGYLLTGENFFIQSYDSAILENETLIKDLSELIPDTSVQYEDFKEIQVLYNRWVNNFAGEQFPDIALIDINMQRMNGLEFLTAIRSKEEWKHLKCFIITTSEEKVDKEAARKLGISGYIVKPFKINNPASMDSFNLMIDLMNM